MTLRFLQFVPSDNPDFPFRPSQLIQVEKLTPKMKAWIKAGAAELVREAADETAVTTAPEKAVIR